MMKPLQIMLEHTKDPMSMEDCSSWDLTKLLRFIRDHKLDPFPLPSKETLAALVNEMWVFVMACMRVIDSIPSDEEAAALGVQKLVVLH